MSGFDLTTSGSLVHELFPTITTPEANVISKIKWSLAILYWNKKSTWMFQLMTFLTKQRTLFQHRVATLKNYNIDSRAPLVTAKGGYQEVWPDMAIYWTLDNFLKPLATINLPTFLGNFCKGVKIFNFSCEIIFGQFFIHLAIFFWSHWYQVLLIVHLGFLCWK